MPRWEVPYESADATLVRYVIGTAVSLLAASVLVCGLVAGGPWRSALVMAVFFTFFATMVWRVIMVGVYVGEPGIKVRGLVRTRVIPWADFKLAWAGPATGFDAWAVWITTNGGDDIETPVWRAGSRARHKNRTKLDPADFSRLIEQLKQEALSRR